MYICTENIYIGGMKMKRVCTFAGHRNISATKELLSALKKHIEILITKENVREFLVGNYGDFDHIAAEAVRELQKLYPHIKLILVIPYLTKVITKYKEQFYEKYDSILMADIPLSTPKNLRIIKSNQYMVDKSDFLICYINRGWGGAAQTVDYADKKGIKVINIAEVK